MRNGMVLCKRREIQYILFYFSISFWFDNRKRHRHNRKTSHANTYTHTHERVHVYCNISSNALSLPYIFQDLAKPNMCIENINMKTTSRIGMWR